MEMLGGILRHKRASGSCLEEYKVIDEFNELKVTVKKKTTCCS